MYICMSHKILYHLSYHLHSLAAPKEYRCAYQTSLTMVCQLVVATIKKYMTWYQAHPTTSRDVSFCCIIFEI